MGPRVDREAPFYFLKSSMRCSKGPAMPYPPGTSDLASRDRAGRGHRCLAFRVTPAPGRRGDLGLWRGTGSDAARLQAKAKAMQRSWDLGKNFEGAAVLAPLTRAGFPARRPAHPSGVNGVTRQDSAISDMVWSIPEIIADLSLYYHLAPGDLIMTGTPQASARCCRATR